MKHGASGATTARRCVSLLVLVLHFFVCVLGTALLSETRAVAAGRRALTGASVASGLGDTESSLASSSDSRIERTARTRGDRARGERGSDGRSFDAFLPCSAPAMAPASSADACHVESEAGEHRPPLPIIHGPRGPPQAR